ncbi:9970_t:CDS:2 [Diversispora eburnea]|uniref:RING-type E3 ubiquitin transferase (cysteine targeting) n=1 Tax=Diversispora eburnea TaxID=1213867 RepID=A0A9N8ZF49_9GLOM|nr:9970_t:CDS:2 [Diversispora eburnea]
MRVSQLDTDLLDIELFDILKEQLWQIFTLFKPNFRVTFEPELLALLQFIMYRLSIYESGASYGAQLQNLKYRNERKHGGLLQSTAKDAPLTKFQKYAFGIMTIGGQYVWMRINQIVTAQGWGELEDVEDGSWGCLRCGEVVKEITRVFEKVVDEEVETSKDIRNNKGNKTKQPVR